MRIQAADIEVSGNALASMVEGFGVFRSLALKHLNEHGLSLHVTGKEPSVDITQWYPMRSCLEAFKEIVARVGPNVMFDIGLSVPKNAKFPPSIGDVDAAIRSLDVAYHMNHRKGGKPMFNLATGEKIEGIGHYGYRRVPDEAAIISECDNPYPCALDLGILTAIARKFAPRSLVEHVQAGPCRSQGGDRCSYLISW
jgi:hypothetical protein